MRNNIGRGYFLETMDTEQHKIILIEPLVDIYFPEDIKKKSALNREPKEGDIVETSNHKQVLLVQVFHDNNSEAVQEELMHGNKIAIDHKRIVDFTIVKDTSSENSIDKLIAGFFSEEKY